MYKKEICIYCGKREGNTRDHIPPRGFFQLKFSNNVKLITVPCCEKCRTQDQRNDTLIRDIILGSLVLSDNTYVKKYISDRVKRSISKRGNNINRILELLRMKETEVLTLDGFSKTKMPAINIDQPEFDRFFKRLSQALFYEAYKQTITDITINWKPNIQIPSKTIVHRIDGVYHQSILDVFYYFITPRYDNSHYAYVEFYKSLNFLIRLNIN